MIDHHWSIGFYLINCLWPIAFDQLIAFDCLSLINHLLVITFGWWPFSVCMPCINCLWPIAFDQLIAFDWLPLFNHLWAITCARLSLINFHWLPFYPLGHLQEEFMKPTAQWLKSRIKPLKHFAFWRKFRIGFPPQPLLQYQHCNRGTGSLAVGGSSLHRGKSSFDAKIIHPNEVCPRL